MKKSIYGVLALALLTFTACGGNETKEEEQEVAKEEEVVTENYVLNAEESTLKWEGSWIGGQNDGNKHDGVVGISEGTVTKEGENYKGTFTVNMNSIDVQDIDEASGKPKLEKHLASEDFFSVEQYGKVDVKLNEIVDGKASITIDFQGVTMNETFPVDVNSMGDNMSISGDFAVDFAKADMKGMSVNPEKPEEGSVSSIINFELDVELTK